ncbi:unnamed protein product [Protopolystoma xenopodis]|uniref:Uncharacterized protein n=1 Tax=Protopolystoma xenopodis TaxID=117903 RepID=A0A448WYK7_9PLAT|nr:unnamed protein product [Protopolystoma xenopodis]
MYSTQLLASFENNLSCHIAIHGRLNGSSCSSLPGFVPARLQQTPASGRGNIGHTSSGRPPSLPSGYSPAFRPACLLPPLHKPPPSCIANLPLHLSQPITASSKEQLPSDTKVTLESQLASTSVARSGPRSESIIEKSVIEELRRLRSQGKIYRVCVYLIMPLFPSGRT